MTRAEILAAKARIAEIDELFGTASGWGSWMVMAANEREKLVDRLRRVGGSVEHKWLARTETGGSVS